MKQYRGATNNLTVRATAPTADGDGFAMSVYDNATYTPKKRSKRYLIRVDVLGAGTACTLALWAKDLTIGSGGGGAWGRTVDASGNFGVLANGTTLSGGATAVSYYFVFEDIGCFAEIVLVQTNTSGSPTVTATITPIIEVSEAG